MKFKRVWSSHNVMDVCIKCGWYTLGDSYQYDKMLKFVDAKKPTDYNISKVAENIYKHSDNECGRTLNDVAFVLALDAVKTLLVEEE